MHTVQRLNQHIKKVLPPATTQEHCEFMTISSLSQETVSELSLCVNHFNYF